MKVNSAFFYSLFALSISLLTMSANVFAKKQTKDERWFEVEVILFQQLGDKAALKEQFPEDINVSNLPNYQKSFDLLGPYIRPNLTHIKQFLPLCTNSNQTNEQPQLLQKLKSVNAAFNEKLKKIEKIPVFELSNINEEKSSTTFDLQIEKLAQPIFNTEIICAVSQQDMEQLFNKDQLAEININSIDRDSLPTTLNALGAHNKKSPYLIADEYLLLNDISQRLRWSKEFKPLLHFGWRQVGITQKKAIPLKLFAGKNLAYEYKKALTDYKVEIQEEILQESNLLEQLTNVQNTKKNDIYNDSQLEVKAQKQQQVLEQLFARFDSINKKIINKSVVNESVVNESVANDNAINGSVNNNTINKNMVDHNILNNTVSQINAQTLDSILATNTTETMVNEPYINISHSPKEPLQPWFLDGFIKVHLDHYLYITADFNVFNQSEVKEIIGTDNINPAKLVNFSQDRRVITGEIHYFDHPYIGMIIQIRRFDPTKPEGEQVSQSIK